MAIVIGCKHSCSKSFGYITSAFGIYFVVVVVDVVAIKKESFFFYKYVFPIFCNLLEVADVVVVEVAEVEVVEVVEVDVVVM